MSDENFDYRTYRNKATFFKCSIAFAAYMAVIISLLLYLAKVSREDGFRAGMEKAQQESREAR